MGSGSGSGSGLRGERVMDVERGMRKTGAQYRR